MFLKMVAALSFLVAATFCCNRAQGQTIEIVVIDMTDLPAGTPLATRIAIQNAIYQAERNWESRLIGFSAVLPAAIRRSVHSVEFTVTLTNIDGQFNVLAFCGPDSFAQVGSSKPYSIPQTASMSIDIEDINWLLAAQLLDDVVMHEMAHGLGFTGDVWQQNRLNLGPFNNYTGTYGLKSYRLEAGKPNAMFVPVEQGGGAGTAGSHWAEEDPFFFNAATQTGDLMLGELKNNVFISETTWSSFADVGFMVQGINDDLPGTGPSDGSGVGPRRTGPAGGAGTGTGGTGSGGRTPRTVPGQ
jgi:hypothetical protein